MEKVSHNDASDEESARSTVISIANEELPSTAVLENQYVLPDGGINIDDPSVLYVTIESDVNVDNKKIESELDNTSNKIMEWLEVDEMLKRIGEFGKAQKIMVLILYLMQIPPSYHTFSWFFTGYSPEWKCAGNNTECNVTGSFGVGDGFYKRRCSMDRSSWEFVKSDTYSIVTEWDLVCEKKEYPFIANSAMWVGWMFGAFIIGELSNKYGRKKMLYLCYTIMITSILGCASSNHHWPYTAFAFLSGFGTGGVYLLVAVMLSELVGPRYKNLLSGAGLALIQSGAICLFGMQAWLIQNWRYLLVVTSAPYVLLLFSFRFMQESVRWQRLNNQLDAAEKTVREMALTNGKPFPAAKLSPPVLSDTTTAGLRDMFKHKVLVKQFLILCCSWFVTAQMSYTIAMASDQLGGSIYRDFFLTNVMIFPATFIAKIASDKLGRKPTFVGSMGIGVIACVAVALVNPNSPYIWGKVVAAMVGQLCLLTTFSAIYVWSAELLPTVVRSQGMGVLSAAARFGGLTVPWVAQWFQHIHYALPFAVIAGFGFLGSTLSSLLPETNKVPTLETFDAAVKNTKEQKRQKIRCSCFSSGTS